VPLTFRVLEALRYDGSMFVGRLAINDVVFVVNASAKWDSEYKGFYYQLFMELWTFNPQSSSVQFDNRFVGIHLNLTTTTA